MRTARETVRLLLVGLLWAASVIALCLPLPAPLAQSGAPEWSRMAQATGVWFAAALAVLLTGLLSATPARLQVVVPWVDEPLVEYGYRIRDPEKLLELVRDVDAGDAVAAPDQPPR